MPRRPEESGVTFYYFQVGVAYAGADHLNERLALASRQVGVTHKLELSIKLKSFHFRRPSLSEEKRVRNISTTGWAFDSNKQASAFDYFFQLLPGCIHKRVFPIHQW